MRHSLRRRYGRSAGRDAGVRFGDLHIGDTFDFISPNHSMNSFFLLCTKTGPRTYSWIDRGHKLSSRVGSLNVKVYHVNESGHQHVLFPTAETFAERPHKTFRRRRG